MAPVVIKYYNPLWIAWFVNPGPKKKDKDKTVMEVAE